MRFWITVTALLVVSYVAGLLVIRLDPSGPRGAAGSIYGQAAAYIISLSWAFAAWMVCFRSQLIMRKVDMKGLLALVAFEAGACWLVRFLQPPH